MHVQQNACLLWVRVDRDACVFSQRSTTSRPSRSTPPAISATPPRWSKIQRQNSGTSGWTTCRDRTNLAGMRCSTTTVLRRCEYFFELIFTHLWARFEWFLRIVAGLGLISVKSAQITGPWTNHGLALNHSTDPTAWDYAGQVRPLLTFFVLMVWRHFGGSFGGSLVTIGNDLGGLCECVDCSSRRL